MGNRTPDLRITRSPGHRTGPATCTDSSTPSPECTQRTECTGFPGHDPGHDRGIPVVTDCYWQGRTAPSLQASASRIGAPLRVRISYPSPCDLSRDPGQAEPSRGAACLPFRVGGRAAGPGVPHRAGSAAPTSGRGPKARASWPANADASPPASSRSTKPPPADPDAHRHCPPVQPASPRVWP